MLVTNFQSCMTRTHTTTQGALLFALILFFCGYVNSVQAVDITSETDVAIEKTVDSTTPEIGSRIQYTITVTNRGPATSTDVTAIERLPAGLTYVSSIATGIYIDNSGSWIIGQLTPGERAVLTIRATVNQNTEGKTITNTASTTASNDTTPQNNTASVAITVACPEGTHASNNACISNVGTLIVKKIVINDNGGNKVAADFTFKINTEEAIAFIQDEGNPLTGSNSISALTSGTYSVTEPAQEGYTTTYENCSNLTITPDGPVTCTITNNDNAPPVVVPPPQSSGGGGRSGSGGISTPTQQGSVLGASTTAQEVIAQECGVYVRKYLRFGSKSNDKEQTIKVQTFLNKSMNANLPVTGFYGPQTVRAVKAFQLKYASEILTPWNIKAPTGIVYLTTANQINKIECPDKPTASPPLIEWSGTTQP